MDEPGELEGTCASRTIQLQQAPKSVGRNIPENGDGRIKHVPKAPRVWHVQGNLNFPTGPARLKQWYRCVSDGRVCVV